MRKGTGEIMRILKIMLITFILGGLAVPMVSCSSEPEAEAIPENQVITVQRGTLTIDITASGNLTLSRKEDLAFKISGTTQEPLTVEEMLVEEGDSVNEGEVITRVDLTPLEQAVKVVQRAVKTAEIDLESARDNYRKITYPYDYRTFTFDVPAAVALNADAKRELDEAVEIMRELGLSREQYDWKQYWDVFNNLTRAQDDLEKARNNLIRGWGPDVFQSGIVPLKDFWTLRSAQLQADKAQLALDRVIDDLETAEDRLGKAVIVAPFSGFITSVNVDGGDEVKRGTVAVTLADPDRFEAEVMVSEMDIFRVTLGQAASVQVDAMPALSLPAEVIHISPTATIQSGVVNYQVKVEVQSLEIIQQKPPVTRQEAAPGELPERLRQAVEEGRITREQAEEMLRQRQQEQQGQMPTMLPEDFQLREGLTVTVTILVEERNDVLLVPNRAITRQGGQTLVQVLKDDVIEERPIRTGMSNYQFTEVIGGLTEGEKIVVPQGTTTPTTQQPGGAMPFLRGGRR